MRSKNEEVTDTKKSKFGKLKKLKNLGILRKCCNQVAQKKEWNSQEFR